MPSDIAFNNGLASLDFETGYMVMSLFPTLFIIFVATLNFIAKWVATKTCISKKRKRILRGELEGVYAFYMRLLIELSLEIGICSMVELSMR